VLNGGAVSFAGITSSAGILITNGANISFSAGGNIATTGTASFGKITSSVLSPNYLPVANITKGLVNSAIQDNGSLITLGRATYVGGNFQANGEASIGANFTVNGTSTFNDVFMHRNLRLYEMSKPSMYSNLYYNKGTFAIELNSPTDTIWSNGNMSIQGSQIQFGQNTTDIVHVWGTL